MQTDKLAWLAGIIDGEGTITFGVSRLSRGRIQIHPLVAIVNTDTGIISECESILRSLGVQYRLDKKTRGPLTRKQNHQILIRKRCEVTALLIRVAPYLHSVKVGFAHAVLKWIEMRDTNLFMQTGYGRIKRKPYSKEEVQLAATTRQHARAIPLSVMLAASNVVQ